jgi:serine/threonine-protein kinase
MNPSEEVQASKKYRLIAEIGRGGMADVYLAVVQGPAGFNKLVVLKKARPELSREPEFLAMFLDEARLAARLNHPNVVQTLEVGQDGERYFIAMEYLDGQPLHRIRSRVGGSGFTLAMQVRVLIDALNGLHHAHELGDFDGTHLGVVHRDATPQNIFVTYDGLVKVVDFGIAKAVDSSSETRTGIIKGKVPYMAPEQAKGEPVDRRTDVFAVGVMLWEAAVGRRMWKGIADIGVLTRLATGEIPSLKSQLPDVNPMFARIVDRALAPLAADRYATAADLQHDLERWLEMSGQQSTAREIGKFVAERFAEDRVRIKALIEGQLKDIRWSGAYPRATGVDLPKIDAGPIMVTPTGSQPALSGPSMPSISGLSEAARSVTSLASAAAAPAPPSPRGASRTVLVLAGLGALLVAALTVVVGRSLLATPVPSSAASSAPAAVSSGEAASPSSAVAAPALVEVGLTVRVTPAKARLFLDGAPLATGSYEGKLRKDGATHQLRVEAPGFVTKEETLTASGDVLMSLSLEKEGATAALPPGAAPAPRPTDKPAAPPVTAAPVAPAPPAPSSPPSTPGLGTGQKPKRAIDSDSPYAQ